MTGPRGPSQLLGSLGMEASQMLNQSLQRPQSQPGDCHRGAVEGHM